MIYCFGDSITDGRPGITYIKYLASPKSCVNCGLGGDTLIGVMKRLKKLLRHPLGKDDRIILGIGTNDILLPHFEGYSVFWQNLVKGHIKRGSIPCSDIDEFRETYRELLHYCTGITANILVFGLPCMETTENNLDEICGDYNQVIESLCRDEKIQYIDFRKWQIDQKNLLQNKGSYFLTANNKQAGRVLLDILLTTYLPFAGKISKKRGLAVTVDGCHLNELSARGLAGLIDQNGEGQDAIYCS